MNTLEWAKREVKIACKKENSNRKEDEFDYGCACYESALKALESLCEDGHSGFSIGFTKNILNRLIDGKPLTPIEDTDNIWRYSFDRNDGTKVYQCLRMSSLFKSVHPDGSIEYSDNDRVVGINVNEPHVAFHAWYLSRFTKDVIGEIKMPYFPPTNPYYVYCEDFLVDPKNGDFDTVGLLYYKTPEGERRPINIYLAENEGDFIRITQDEYLERKAHQIEKQHSDDIVVYKHF